MTQNSGSRAYEYLNSDINLADSLKTLLNYFCKKSNDYEESAYSDIFDENTITFKESYVNNTEKSENINIFSDKAFISRVTNPLDFDDYEKHNLIDELTQMAIYARIYAGIKCFDEKYIDLEGLKAAINVLGMEFNSSYGSEIEEKIYNIKKLEIESLKNT